MTEFISRLQDIFLFREGNPLVFNSGLFLFLFLAFLGVYHALRRWAWAKMLFVIAFSLYFYYKSSAQYCLILLGVCLSDYLLGLLMGVVKNRAYQRFIIALNLFLNLGMLVYFKYFNLLYETFANITGTSFDPLNIVLPLGISFFTFRSISYLVDIYRGEIQPCRNFLQYTFYLTFFPPLLAGPVVRAKDILPQVAQNPVATRIMVGEGFFLIMVGLIKKVMIADYISVNFVDRIFENPTLYTGFENLMGSIAFTLQLYCDFSGYSDMAIGIALLLGFRFKDNFRSPFKAQSPTEFWKRWHISLSSWLMDYLYIPLGGNRKGVRRQQINLMITMLLGGLWHGATWMYVVWGGYHGALLVGHKAIKRAYRPPEKIRGMWLLRVFNIFVTFMLIVIGFVFFRAASMQDAWDIISSWFTNFRADIAPQFVEGYKLIVAAIVVGFVAHFLPQSLKDWLKRSYAGIPLWVQGVILAAVIFAVIQARQASLVPFIYFQY